MIARVATFCPDKCKVVTGSRDEWKSSRRTTHGMVIIVVSVNVKCLDCVMTLQSQREADERTTERQLYHSGWLGHGAEST